MLRMTRLARNIGSVYQNKEFDPSLLTAGGDAEWEDQGFFNDPEGKVDLNEGLEDGEEKNDTDIGGEHEPDEEDDGDEDEDDDDDDDDEEEEIEEEEDEKDDEKDDDEEELDDEEEDKNDKNDDKEGEADGEDGEGDSADKTDEKDDKEGDDGSDDSGDELGVKSSKQSDKQNAAFAKMRRHSASVEKSFKSAIDALQKAQGDKSSETRVTALKGELQNLNKNYMAAVRDENEEEATRYLDQITDKQTEIARAQNGHDVSLATAQSNYDRVVESVNEKFYEVQAEMLKEYPVLDMKSGSGNEAYIRIINSSFDSKVSNGVTPAEALIQAVEEFVAVGKIQSVSEIAEEKAPKKDAKKEVTKKRTKKSVNKRVKAATSKAKRSKRTGASKTAVAAAELSKMSNEQFGSKENAAAMKKEFGITFDE